MNIVGTRHTTVIHLYLYILHLLTSLKGEGKAIPVLAQIGLEVSRKMTS